MLPDNKQSPIRYQNVNCPDWQSPEAKWNRRSTQIGTRVLQQERTMVPFRHVLICLFMTENFEYAHIHLILIVCFFGLLRISNVGIQSVKKFDPSRNIQIKDVKIIKKALWINVKWSKTHQTKGEMLWLPACKTELLCPV